MPNLIKRVGAAIKAASWAFSQGNGYGSYQGSYSRGWGWGTGNGSIDYEGVVGEAWRHSSVFTMINWLRRNYPEAPIGVSIINEDVVEHSHAFANLIRRPNPFYSRTTLWAGTVLSYVADGNAYWFKKRNALGEVVELWYRPHWLVRPVRAAGSAAYLDYYEYWVGNRWVRVERSDVVHLRNGIDPDNEMRGLSDLAKIFKAIFSDDECDAFCAYMLMNMGVPGAVFMHGTQGGSESLGNPLDPDAVAQANFIRAHYEAHTTGSNRARPLVLDGDWKVEWPKVVMDPNFVAKVKNISQADIAAAIGIPAVVLGFLVGLETSTAKASYADSRQQAYTDCLIPMQTSIAEDLTLSLLPDFESDPMIEVAYDYTKVAALSENSDAKAGRFQKLADAASKFVTAGFDPVETLAALELPEIAYNKPMAQDTTTGTQGVTNQTTTTDQPIPSQDGNGNLVQVAGDGNGTNGAGNKHAGGVAGKHVAVKAIRPGEPTNDEMDEMIRARRRLAQERAAGQ